MKEFVPTPKYTAVEDLSGLYSSNKKLFFEGLPDFVNQKREKALADFLRQGIPSSKMENYRYTDLRPYFEGNFDTFPRNLDQNIDILSLFRCDVPRLDTYVVLTINGWFYNKNQDLNLPQGVIIDSLQKSANKYPDLIAEYYAKHADSTKDSLVALNTLFAKDGLFIYVPDNVILDKPIQVINLLRSGKDAFITQRNLFIVGKNSQAKVVFCDHTLSPCKYISNKLTEVTVKENGVFDFYSIQNQHNDSVNLNSTFVYQEKATSTQISTASLHGGLVRNNVEVELGGEDAETNLSGLSLTDKNQHVDNYTYVDHISPLCTSNQLYKSVGDDESTNVFSGRIHVWRNAQKTIAYQRNNNVLLSPTAKVFAKPQLVIDANDVKCSHGATVGKIDAESLFYLRSRGISETEAKHLLMFAFVHEVVDSIHVKPLHKRLDELVEKRFSGEISKCHKCINNCSK